jgi:hypothetical protein
MVTNGNGIYWIFNREGYQLGIKTDQITGEKNYYGWRYIKPLDEEHRRDRRIKGYIALFASVVSPFVAIGAPIMAFYFLFEGELFLAFLWLVISIVSLISAPISIFTARFTLSDTKPFPATTLHIPERIKIIKNEPWRQPTTKSELENVKTEIIRLEKREKDLFEDACKVVKDDSVMGATGYLDYKEWSGRLDRYEQFREEYAQAMADLKDRAERLYRGDISREVVEIESRITQLKLDQDQIREYLKEIESEVTASESRIRRKLLETTRREQKQRVKDIDKEIVDCNRRIEALRAANKGDLYQGIDAPVEALQTPSPELKDIKIKTDTFTGIPQRKNEQPNQKEAIQNKIDELREAKKSALDALDVDDEEGRLRIENMYDNKINHKLEELEEYL